MVSHIGLETETRSGSAFDALVQAMQRHATAALDCTDPRVFTVETAGDLWDLYLANLLQSDRQHHTCTSCRHFVRRYGALVIVADDGTLTPLCWPAPQDVPEPYAEAVAALNRAVRRGTITGVALTTEAVWGTPVTGPWTHFALTPPAAAVYRPTLTQTAFQVAAAKHEDYGTLRRGLAEFSRETVAQALTLLDADALYRAEKVIGPARFLLALHDLTARGRQRDNLIWRAVASAPAGFCQPRSTMVGTLLSDIAEGLDFGEVSRRFAAKMHPLQYQRPQAAPAAGNIAQAEQLIEALGIASALRRRFARLDELQTIWQPTRQPEAPPAGGVFGHLLPKQHQPLAALTTPEQAITWEKFARTVLPTAQRIEVYVSGRMNFCGLVTASDPESAPLLQWDSAEQRNPVSWYVYNAGSPPEQWGLRPQSWVPVTAVTLQPSMWFGERFPHQGKSAIFVLDGARDTQESGLGLFPETLQAALHAVRATVEAYVHSRQLEGREEASANGLRVGNSASTAPIRVTTALGTLTYRIDRWD